MALDTYDDLVAEVALWSNRNDSAFAARIPTFIALLEDQINNGDERVAPLRLREMETEASITLTAGVGDLPDDYLGYRDVSRSSGVSMQPSAPGFASQQTLYSGGGSGQFFSISGSSIITYPADTGPLTFTYWAKVPALSADNPTNWLLTKAPRVYLFGTLMMAINFAAFTNDLSSKWAAGYAGAVGGLINADTLGKYARASVRTFGPTP